MTAIVITVIIGVTAVTIYAMRCSNVRVTDTQKIVAQEITKQLVEKAVKDGDTGVQ